MARKQKPPAILMTDGKREIIRQLLSEYDIKTAEDIQDALFARRHNKRNDGSGDGLSSRL